MLSVVKEKQNYMLIMALALFNFIFLGNEYLFDDMIAFFTNSSGVVMAQNEVLGASVLGFVLYSFIDKEIVDARGRKITAIVISAISCLLVFLICMHRSFMLILLSGVGIFVLFGIMGSAICFNVSRMITDRGCLARLVGISYAFGVLLQFINNNLVKNALIQGIDIGVCIVVLTVIMLQFNYSEAKAEENNSDNTDNSNKPVIAAVFLVICVALMTVIFSTLDVAVTLVHASGEFNIGQWPRLLLALSGLAAGFLFDIYGRKFMSAMMYVVTILATLCIVVIQFGGPFIIGLLIFYMPAGFFVVYFTTAFMDISFKVRNPKLWAGMGRATNNFCAFIVSAVSVALISNGSQFAVIITALILFALINISLMIYIQFDKMSDDKIGDDDKAESQVKIISEEEKLALFAEKYELTAREVEVLKALIESDDNVQTIAQHLGFSRTVLYRHISSINKKTETSSRVGIIQFYHNSVF
ncbi:MAG: LuxR family transcriptional regulator [Agathobacter sp.]|nr:LuxR family transcriptional regulator [Agathobacter sp.]